MRKSPKCDPQREEVYAWERKKRCLWYAHAMPMGTARALLAKMCRYYKVPLPAFKMVDDAPWTAAAWGDALVEVNKSRANPTAPLLAHEVAHIVSHSYGIEEPPHGPMWLGIYLQLLDKFKILPRCMTEPSARKAGLKFKTTGIMPGEL